MDRRVPMRLVAEEVMTGILPGTPEESPADTTPTPPTE